MQRRILTMIATVCVIIFCAVSYQGIRSLASSGEEQVKFKYYTQVTLAYGETLWDLSEDYIDYEEYKDKNILFATFCMGPSQWLGQVKSLPGEHYVVNNTYAFYSRYMVTVMPRYMLIDPEGRIVDVDAPKPSSSAKLLLRSVGL